MRGRLPPSFNTLRKWETLKITTACDINFRWRAECDRFPEVIITKQRSEEAAIGALLRGIASAVDK